MVRWAVGPLWQGAPQQTYQRLDTAVGHAVRQAGRDTIIQNTEKDPAARWARIPTGAKTCAFCLVMASRGWVYRSAAKAGAHSGSKDPRLTGSGPNVFHHDCDCLVVATWDKPNFPDYDPDQLYDLYTEARTAGGGDLHDILTALRRQHPELLTDGVEPAHDDEKPMVFDTPQAKTSTPTRTGFDDLPTLQDPETYKEAAMRSNPGNYGVEQSIQGAFTMNCHQVVHAIEMRARGYDVVAQETVHGLGRTDAAIAADWIDPEIDAPRLFTHNARNGRTPALKFLAHETATWPVGARGYFAGQWKSGGGHIFSIEKTDRGIVAVDGQGQGRNAPGYFTQMRPGSVSILRVDDLEPAESILTRVMPPPSAPPVATTRSQIDAAQERIAVYTTRRDACKLKAFNGPDGQPPSGTSEEIDAARKLFYALDVEVNELTKELAQLSG